MGCHLACNLKPFILPSLDLYLITVMLYRITVSYKRDELEKIQIQAARIAVVATKFISINVTIYCYSMGNSTTKKAKSPSFTLV